MEILLQLGANQTAFIQFIIFIATISFLTLYVFRPYFKAYDERHRLTKGADQVAFETEEEAKKMAQIYSARAREINEKMNAIFNTSRADSIKSSDIILEAAKNSVSQSTAIARKEIESQKHSAKGQLSAVAQDVSKSIVLKVSGAQ